jgi:hypothetical protein
MQGIIRSPESRTWRQLSLKLMSCQETSEKRMAIEDNSEAELTGRADRLGFENQHFDFDSEPLPFVKDENEF